MKIPKPLRAFTLIELLTVIAIIGILAAIIIPTVAKVRQSARRSQCFGNLKSIVMAAHMFANDNKGKFPVTDDPASGVRTGNGTPNSTSTGLIDQLYTYANGSIPSFYCAGVVPTSTYTYASQNARTDGLRFRQMGYYWLSATNNLSNFGASGTNIPERPQRLEGESGRIMTVCIYNVGGSGRPHDNNLNIAFADGHTGTLGSGKSINTGTVDFKTMLLKK